MKGSNNKYLVNHISEKDVDEFDQVDLDPLEKSHLLDLKASWNLLADLSFSDLILLLPNPNNFGNFIVVGLVRPATAQTLYPQDLIGREIASSSEPQILKSYTTGKIIEHQETGEEFPEPIRMTCVPVRRSGGKVFAVLAKVSREDKWRRFGQLEQIYQKVGERLMTMVAQGKFPFQEVVNFDELPRVGDGLLLVDAQGISEFASPNAVSTLHRTGFHESIAGLPVEKISVGHRAFSLARQLKRPATEEYEAPGDITVLSYAIPLLEMDRFLGCVILFRDLTELRRRDRLLLTKDAAIREVHHRVKNNLQTISSLLRLQARRMSDEEARSALREAERRVRSIAIVHDILSREGADQVPFNQIMDALVRMIKDSVPDDKQINVEVNSQIEDLLAEIATPLSVVIAELIQNAIEHAFELKADHNPTVSISIFNEGSKLIVMVADNGTGLPSDFSLENTSSLGLLLVRDLVKTQLNGEISFKNANGLIVKIIIPAHGLAED